MWKWFNCYLSGRHDYGKWCESGAIFLRCIHCGKRSSGWIVSSQTHARTPHVHSHTPHASASPVSRVRTATRVLPFQRAAAR